MDSNGENITRVSDMNGHGGNGVTKKRRNPANNPKPRGSRPQQVTRIPPYRPGMWVKLKDHDGHTEFDNGLCGKVLRVKSLTCSITGPDQPFAVWRVHFDNGRCVEWHGIERVATESEARIAAAKSAVLA